MRDKYFYSIYTAFNFNGVMSDPELWVERKSLTILNRILYENGNIN